MPDPITTAVATFAGGVLLKGGLSQLEDFIGALVGRKGETIGTILGDGIRTRYKNAESVAQKAHFILLNIGVPPKQLTTNVLYPILEGGSLQEDEYFQTRWAYLLANAADSRNRHPFEICFSGMLRNLSLREVKFLDGLFTDKRQFALNERRLQTIYRDIGLARHPAPPNTPTQSPKIILNHEDEAEFELMMDILERETILADDAEGKSGVSRFTRLGFAFVQACQKPEGFAGALA